jgi:hypothetical protein
MCGAISCLSRVDQHLGTDRHETTPEECSQGRRIAWRDLSPDELIVRDQPQGLLDEPAPRPDRGDTTVEQLDGDLGAPDQPAADRHETVLVAVNADVSAVVSGAPHPRVLVQVAPPRERTATSAAGHEHGVMGADQARGPCQPSQHVWFGRPAVAVDALGADGIG